jgi:alanine dehydrogenase
MIRKLSEEEIADLLDLESLLPVIADAMVKIENDEVECPPRPHTPIGEGLDSDLGMELTMPAYIHGEEVYTTKLLGIFDQNPKRDLPTAKAQIAVKDAETGLPVAYMGGTRVTNSRTACMGGLAAKHLTSGSLRVGVIGAGSQGKWQTRGIAAGSDVEDVRIYSPSDSKYDAAETLDAELDAPVDAVKSPRDAVEDADIVVTGTTASEPTFPEDALAAGVTVVAVGAYTEDTQELDPAVLENADQIFGDSPDEVRHIGDWQATDLGEDDIRPYADVFMGEAERQSDDERIVVESVGSAVFDAATSGLVYEKAVEEDVGTEFSLETA